MQTTTNYGFNIVEGTDIVNPLTQLNPNFTALDTDLKAVSDNTVDNATCIKTGTVHAVTRVNTSANIFRFTATGNWNAGDTMTVDGTLVSVYVTDGTAPSNGCFVINTEVLASIQGTRVTLYVNSGDASNIAFDDTSVSYTASNVQTALEYASTAAGTEYTTGVSVKDKIDGLPVNAWAIVYGQNVSSTTPTAITTTSNRSLTKYPCLAFTFVKAGIARATVICPSDIFSNGVGVDLSYVGGDNNRHSISVSYNSDTSVQVSASQANNDYKLYAYALAASSAF